MSDRGVTAEGGALTPPFRSLGRAAVAIALLVGLFAMHGLTTDHNMATLGMTGTPTLGSMAAHHTEVTAHDRKGDAPVVIGAMQAGGSDGLSPSVHVIFAAAVVGEPALSGGPSRTDGMPGMAGGCVAILSGLLLMLLAARALTGWRTGRRTHALWRPVSDAASAARRAFTVDLGEICVLRT